MVNVLGKPTLKRQDVAIGIGRTQRLGARWLVSGNIDGSAAEPKKLAGYTGELRLTSDQGDPWLVKPLDVEDGPISSGLVSVTIDPSDTSSPAWSGRSLGKWSFVMTSPDGEVIVLASGIARIIQEGTL